MLCPEDRVQERGKALGWAVSPHMLTAAVLAWLPAPGGDLVRSLSFPSPVGEVCLASQKALLCSPEGRVYHGPGAFGLGQTSSLSSEVLLSHFADEGFEGLRG